MKQLSKLVKFIVHKFSFFCMIKNIFNSKIFFKNASLLQKLKNKMPFRRFTIKEIPSVINEVIKLAVYGSGNT